MALQKGVAARGRSRPEAGMDLRTHQPKAGGHSLSSPTTHTVGSCRDQLGIEVTKANRPGGSHETGCLLRAKLGAATSKPNPSAQPEPLLPPVKVIALL